MKAEDNRLKNVSDVFQTLRARNGRELTFVRRSLLYGDTTPGKGNIFAATKAYKAKRREKDTGHKIKG